MGSYDVLATCISEYPDPYFATIHDACPANDLARGLISLYPQGREVEWFHSTDIGCERYYDLVGAAWSASQIQITSRCCGESSHFNAPVLFGNSHPDKQADRMVSERALFHRLQESEDNGESIRAFQQRLRLSVQDALVDYDRWPSRKGALLHLLVHPVVVGQLLCWYHGYPHTWIATFAPAHGDSYLLRIEVGDTPADWRIVSSTEHPRASLPAVKP